MKTVLSYLVIIILAGLLLQANFFLEPVDPSSSEEVGVVIERGFSTRRIAEELQENGLIHSALFFNLYTSLKGTDQAMQAGYYELSPADSMREIILDLTSGNVATFQITIPEGFTVEEVAGRLAELTEHTAEDFLAVARSEEISNLLGESFPVPENPVIFPVEGFLYPATYTIPRNYSPREILGLFIQEFTKRWKQRLLESGQDLSAYELVTLASMVEKEAQLKEEKPLIAGVIYNRLQENMLLQIDATIQYSLSQRQQILLYSDLRLDSPYNTYLHQGLPPGPIANPGDNALEAVLEPRETEYLFYFASEDGGHTFSRTYEEHRSRLQEFREQNSN